MCEPVDAWCECDTNGCKGWSQSTGMLTLKSCFCTDMHTLELDEGALHHFPNCATTCAKQDYGGGKANTVCY
jgi:hypothetical protein